MLQVDKPVFLKYLSIIVSSVSLSMQCNLLQKLICFFMHNTHSLARAVVIKVSTRELLYIHAWHQKLIYQSP